MEEKEVSTGQEEEGRRRRRRRRRKEEEEEEEDRRGIIWITDLTGTSQDRVGQN